MIKGIKFIGGLDKKEIRRLANKRFRDKHKKKSLRVTEPTSISPPIKLGICEYCDEQIMGNRNEHYKQHKEDRIAEGK